MGPLTLGAVTVLDRVTDEVIGHAYSVLDGRGQRQRWLLFRHPRNSIRIGPPSPDMACWTLDDWNAAVPDMWRDGSYYVRAQAVTYEYGCYYDGVCWDRIPSNERLLEPVYPPGGDDFQLDHYTHLTDIETPALERVGSVFTEFRLDDPMSREYWLLSPAYAPAGGASPAALREGTVAVETLARFVEHANGSWVPGAKLVIVGCKNYRGSASPSLL